MKPLVSLIESDDLDGAKELIKNQLNESNKNLLTKDNILKVFKSILRNRSSADIDTDFAGEQLVDSMILWITKNDADMFKKAWLLWSNSQGKESFKNLQAFVFKTLDIKNIDEIVEVLSNSTSDNDEIEIKATMAALGFTCRPYNANTNTFYPPSKPNKHSLLYINVTHKWAWMTNGDANISVVKKAGKDKSSLIKLVELVLKNLKDFNESIDLASLIKSDDRAKAALNESNKQVGKNVFTAKSEEVDLDVDISQNGSVAITIAGKDPSGDKMLARIVLKKSDFASMLEFLKENLIAKSVRTD